MTTTFPSPAPPPTDYLTTDELAAGRFELIAIDKLHESPLNPRKRFDQHKLIELADSIRRQGIITPLLVRPVQYLVSPGYEIAAGHRRYRAAQEAGLEYVPCIVREMADDAFLEVLVIENVQREDVHPLEEAEGYQKLLAGRYDAAAIAAKIGKAEAYVYGRLELLKLVEVVRGSFFRGDITIGHARQIARLDVKRQEEELRACFRRNWHTQREELVAAADLKRWIRDNAGGKDLAKAPFELSDASLGAPACHECPQAAGVNPLLVDPDGDKTCLELSPEVRDD